MKKYNIKIGSRGGFSDVEIEIPEDIKFFYHPNAVGPFLTHHSQHYTTVVEYDKYKDWIDSVRNHLACRCNHIGKYVVLTIMCLHEDTPLPSIDREEWFKENKIDFNQYTFVTYDDDYLAMNAYKIISFQDIWNIDVECITIRDFFSNGDMFTIRKHVTEWNVINPSPVASRIFTLKTYDGDQAKMIWNTMFASILSHYTYESKYVDNDYDFLEVQKEELRKLGFDSMKEYRTHLENRKKDLSLI